MQPTTVFSRLLALGCGLLVVLLGVVGAWLHAGNEGNPLAAGVSDWWAMGVVAAMAFGPTGAWLAAARPRLPLGWLLLAIGLLSSVSLVSTEIGLWAFDRGSDGADVALWWGNWLWVVGLVPIASVVPLLVPDGRLASPRWRLALAMGVAAAVAGGASFAFEPYEATTPGLADAGFTNPVTAAFWASPGVEALLALMVVAGALTGVTGLVVRWRASEGLERQQLKWVLVGVAGALLLFALGFALGPTFSALAMAPLPVGVAVAVLRHRLADVDLVISRSLLYLGLSTLVVVLYLAVVSVLGVSVGVGLDGTDAAAVVATAVVAVVVLPLRDRVQRRVNRLVHGDPEEPQAVLMRLGDRLAAASTPDDLAAHVFPSVAEAVTRSLHADNATLTLRDGLAASYGRSATSSERSATLSKDLEYAGEHLGRLDVTRQGGFDKRSERTLDRLAAQASVAAHTVHLARETQRAREAAVLAREEERRRLRRDLHDGVGPSLAALALQMETARTLTARDPAAATALMDRLTSRLNATVAEVRAMVNDLRPPMLDELGLAAAVRELGDRLTTATTRVTTAVEPLPELPAAVEVAAYQIAGEATANAARHAGAARVAVTLGVVDGMIRVEVRDNGHGMAADARPGIGLASMDERAQELGGRLEVASGRGGTTVTALLPKEAT